MKRFVLIDHSMCDLAGHHYEYAMHVLRAAEAAGYDPVLITNRKFNEPGAAPWPVMPLYEFGFWPEPALPWYARLAARFGPRLRKFWCAARCRLLYSGIGLAWSCRFEWKRYLQLRPASLFEFPKWLLGTASILAFKLLRLLWLTLLLPVVVIVAGAWLLLNGFRSAARIGVRTAYKAGAAFGFPRPLYTYFRLFAGELDACVRFAASLLGAIFRRVKGPEGPSRQEIRQSRAFSRDTAAMLSALKPGASDVFFFPTISARDLLALTKPLRNHSDARLASWHFLFRRNIYVGRESEYAKQDPSLNPLREAFLEFRRKSEGARVYFYTDTDELTAQHNRLGVFEFHTLPIPHTHSVKDRAGHAGPLRLTYLGDARGEKGFHLLPRLAADIRQDCLASGKVRFVVQCNYNIPGGEPQAAVARAKLETLPPEHAELFKQPLTSAEYRELLLSADVNLLFYDPVNYYARSSGILVESLAAGIPVIAPAGCWLSRQFSERHRAHVAQLRETMRVLAGYTQASIPWERHGSAGIRPDCAERLRASYEQTIITWLFVPPGSTHLLITVEFDDGRSAQLSIDELDWHEQPVKAPRTFLLEPSGERSAAALSIPLHDDLYRVWLSVGCREGENVVLRNIRVDFLKPLQAECPPPLGAVGAIYHDEAEIPGLVRDLVRHYPHYARTAAEFAAGWREYHNADRLVRDMEEVAGHGPAAHAAPALSGSGSR